MTSDLPIETVVPDLRSALARDHGAIVAAPTGSGKSTRLPVVIADALGPDRRVVVLQPRRLATRLVSRRVAETTGGRLGDRVGFQTRHERAAGAATRILFSTEGLFLRQLLGPRGLEGVGAVVLDEFHERTLDAEIVLGLLRRERERAPDLGLVVMSATLDVDPLRAALDLPVLEAGGRTWPVTTSYATARSTAPIWDRAADAIASIIRRDEPGDVLVFMPGAWEIRRTIEAGRTRVGGAATFFPLYGALSTDAQDAALAPCARRKVIVATNVAETSITIDGVRHVVDAGLARTHRFDPRRGIDTLYVEPISQASADQRAGRAGRTAPGTCNRLWTEPEHRARPKHTAPEVRRVDLAGPLLVLRAMGEDDPAVFPWLDPPDPHAVEVAEARLRELGAIDPSGALTAAGRAMGTMPVHPRISRFLLEAGARRAAGRAVVWAALVAEREILGRAAPPDLAADAEGSDLVVRERVLARARAASFDPGVLRQLGADPGATRELDRAVRQLERIATASGLDTTQHGDSADLVRAMLVAYPDRIAVRRREDDRTCAMPGLNRVELDAASVATGVGPLLAVGVREIGHGDRVRTVLSLATPVDPAWLREVHPERVRTREEAVWDDDIDAVRQETALTYDDMPFAVTRRDAVDPAAAVAVLAERVRTGALTLTRWDDTVEQWIVRTRCVAAWFPERSLVTYDDDDLAVIIPEIIEAATRRLKRPATRASHVRDQPCLEIVQSALSWDDRTFVESMAPTHLGLPRGRRMRLVYEPGLAPLGRARIQDLYDLDRTPTVAGGRIPVRLDILAPNQRPVQRTDDLAGFWATLYPEVRKELRRRYPKHEWR